MAALPAVDPKPRLCFVGLDNLPVLAREYNHLNVGGEPIQQTLLATAFARRGYPVSMIVGDYGQPDGAEWQGVKTFKAYRMDAGLPVVRFIHPRWTGLWAALKRADADVYYISCSSVQVGQVAMFCRQYKRKMIFRSASDADCDPALPLIRYSRDKRMYMYGLKRAHAVLAQSSKQQRMLADNFGIPSIVAGMLVESGELRSFTDRDIALLWVSNIRRLKRPDLFIELSRRLPHLTAAMVGGPMRGDAGLFEQVREQAKGVSQLTFHGRVAYHDVGSVYDRARVLVNTSDLEGFPNTYLQAWARGIPVVSFFDPDGLIAKRGLGRAVRDLDEMQAAVQELATNESVWREASERCRVFMAREFGEDVVLAAYERAIEQALRA